MALLGISRKNYAKLIEKQTRRNRQLLILYIKKNYLGFRM